MQEKKPSDARGGEGRSLHICVDCGTESPEVETSFTLISARHGWRLTRSTDAKGQTLMQWRCPSCWSLFKSQQEH
jgi:hypothetical protein